MLTIKSNFNTFKDRLGQKYTVEDLQKLSKNVITTDIINLRGNISYGYTDAIAKEVIKKLTINNSDLILIINDLSLEMYNALTDAGYKNIMIAYGKWTKAAMPEDDDTVYNIMTNYIKANFKEQIKIIKLKEIFNMKYKVNAIIANPPYGAIGANITKTIIEKVDFDEYVNLLPANDYKRNKDKDLFNYQSDMETLTNGCFADATVIPHIAKIHKTKVNNLSYFEFLVSQFTDRDLDKYFIRNVKFPGGLYSNSDSGNHPEKWEQSKTILIGFRDCSAGHMPYSKNCNTYKWNVDHSIDTKYIIDNCNYYAKSGRGFRVPYAAYFFNTELEHNNFIEFFYSDIGFKFISKVMTALNTLSAVDLDVWAPKVDWARSWTVEEILADYGYTETEIKEVMDDLVNYKGLSDD